MTASAAGPCRVYRLIGGVPRGVGCVCHRPWHHGRAANSMLAFPHRRGRWACDIVNSWGLSVPLPVAHWYDKRGSGFDHELVHASGHPAHGIGPEWPLGGKAVFLPDFLPRVENGGAGETPVYDLRRAPPRLFRPSSTSRLSAGAWVGSGHTMGLPSQRAIRKNRLRVVGAP